MSIWLPHGHKKRAVGTTLIEVIIAERSLEEFIASLFKREVWRECQYRCHKAQKKSSFSTALFCAQNRTRTYMP